MQLEHEIQRYGASQFGTAVDRQTNRVMIQFTVRGRKVRIEVSLPKPENTRQVRSRWRALYLTVKAKLESVDAGIETFEEAFLAHIVMPDGRRFGEITVPQLEHLSR